MHSRSDFFHLHVQNNRIKIDKERLEDQSLAGDQGPQRKTL